MLRGPPGAGKSGLALTLMLHARMRGDFARLVGDDRVELDARGGRLIARPHQAIAGMLESRGHGLLRVAHEPACTLDAIVDVLARDDPPTRYPEESQKQAQLHGVTLPRLFATGSDAAAVARIFAFIQSDKTI